MKAKSIIILTLAFLVIALVYLTPKFSGKFNIFPKLNVKAPSGFDILSLLHLKKTTTQNVLIEIDDPRGVEFNIPNATMRIKGICKSSIPIGGDHFIYLEGEPCNVTLTNSIGTIKFLSKNTIMTNIKPSLVEINSLSLSLDEFVSEIVLTNLITSVSASNIEIPNFQGKITILTSSGAHVGEMNFPPCKNLKIDSFIGTLDYKEGKAYLSGVAKNLEYECE